MPATTDDSATSVLEELTRRGVHLRVDGPHLRYRPKSAVPPALMERLQAHKVELMARLAASDATVAHFSVQERRLMALAPADLRAAAERIKSVFAGAEVVSVRVLNPAPKTPDTVDWVTGELAAVLPRAVAALARARDGWTPRAWRDRLLQLAACCENLNPEQAFDLRRAAIAMTPAVMELFEERAAIMQYDGRMSRDKAEVAAVADTLIQLGKTS